MSIPDPGASSEMPYGNFDNNRIFYAVHAIGFAPFKTNNYEPASGVQSVGTNVNFNLEQVFQLGQLEIYEQVENIPNVEATVEKALDGAPLIQHLASQDATASTLIGRYSNTRCMMAVAFYNDTNSNATGTPLSETVMSGMYVSSIAMNFPVNGNFTESVTLVGNDKVWATGSKVNTLSFKFIPTTYGDSGTPVSNIQRRQHLVMSGCRFPLDIPGIHTSSSGTNNLNTAGASAFAVAFQTIGVNVNLGRTEMFELGRRGPYHRYADFPTQVSCSFEIIAKDPEQFVEASSTAASNVSNQSIYFLLTEGSRINLGSKNKLVSISSTGANAGDTGNRTVTYQYQNFNTLKVTHPLDPVSSLRP